MNLNTMEVNLTFGRFRGQNHHQRSLQKSLVWVLLVLTFCLNICQLTTGQEEEVVGVGEDTTTTTVTIKTPLGNVRGQRLQHKGLRGETPTTVDKFLGIPFAEPPVGKLRFRQPKPHGGWTGTLEATTVPPGCIGKSRMVPPPLPPSLPAGGDELPGGFPAFPPKENDNSVADAEPEDSQMPPSLLMPNAPGAPAPGVAGPPPGRMPSWLGAAAGFNSTLGRRRRKRQAPPVPELFGANADPPAVGVNATVGEDHNNTLSSGSGAVSQEEVISPGSGSVPPASGSVPPASGSVPPASGSVPPASGSVPPASGGVPPASGGVPPAIPAAEETTEPIPAAPKENTEESSGAVLPEEIDLVGDDSTTPSEIIPEVPSVNNIPGPPPVPSNDTDSNQEVPFATSSPTQGGPFGPREPTPEGPFGPREPTQEGPFGPREPTQEGPFGPRVDPTPGGPSGWDRNIPMNSTDPEDTDWSWFIDTNDTRNPSDGVLAPLPPNLNPRAPPRMFKPPITTETSEDCLFLNVFVPRSKNNKTGTLPVMVYIHGGGLTAGHALENDPTNLAIETDSIVVTMAYRLHVYGFFSLPGSLEYPGNLGLWDQVAALQWVQENIGSFGGDPGRVTLAGFSAGAMCVSMHVASPASAGLFQGALSMSGARWDLELETPSTQAASESLLAALQCGGPLDHACIMNATQAIVDVHASILKFFPVVDGQFFPENPLALVEKSSYNKVPYLLGMNSDEGLLLVIFLLQTLGDSAFADKLGDMYMLSIRDQIGTIYDIEGTRSWSLEKITELIQGQYLWDTHTVTGVLRKIIDLSSDMFVSPIKIAADAIAAKQPEVYLYYFNHTPTATKKIYEDSMQIEVGAGHAEVLHLLLGRTDLQMSNYELELSEEFLSSVKSFVHTRKPSLPGFGEEVVDWPAYDKTTANFVEFGVQGPEVTYRISSGFPVKTVSFWTDVLPAFIQDLEEPCPYLPPPMVGHPSAGEIVVRTSYGRVRGVFDTRPQLTGPGTSYQQFLGIPYAASPTGERRWQLPDAPTRWQHIRQALTFPPSCPQPGEGNHNENCLNLNVWVPVLPGHTSETLLPVVVYIHGGGFLTGNGNDPGLLSMGFDLDSIVVSVNFRLGALGFLSLGSTEYPGNYAHMDIIMALRWVQENIFAFGGNPSKVILFGVDSGAALASQIALSRYASGLITNVMTTGGSANAPWANDLKPKETAKSLARKMACPDEEETAMIACLLKKDAMALASVGTLEGATSVHGYTSPLASYPWRPVVEGITDWSHPLDPYSSIRFLSGVTEHEGYQMFATVIGDTDDETRDNFLEFLEEFVRNELQGSNSVYEAIKSTYFPLDVLADEARFKNASIELWTDWAYLAPLVETFSSMSQIGYAYRLSYVPKEARQPGLATHGDDFNLFFRRVSDTPEQLGPLIAFIFNVRLLGFVKDGMPHDQGYSNEDWSEYQFKQGFLRISQDVSFIDNEQLDSLTAARIRLWTDGIPEMISSLSCTPKGLSSVPTDHNDEGQGVPTETPGSKEDNGQLETGGDGDGGNRPNALASTSRPGIVGLALFESQIIMFALGGACVLFLLIIIIMAMVNASLKRRLAGRKDTDKVAFAEDLKYATKM